MGLTSDSSPSLADTDKLTVSLWFRVPQASIDAAIASAAYDGSPLDGIIPLVVMGGTGSYNDTTQSEQTGVLAHENWGPLLISPGIGGTYYYSVHSVPWDISRWYAVIVVASDYPPPTYLEGGAHSQSFSSTFKTVLGASHETAPSYIGIDCTGSSPVISTNFETGMRGSGYGVDHEVQHITPSIERVSGTPSGTSILRTIVGISFPFGLDIEVETVISDTSQSIPFGTGETVTLEQAYDATPTDITGITLNTTAAFGGTTTIEVTPDVWHHLLVSIEMNDVAVTGGNAGSSSVSSAPRLFIALDDVNYTGNDISGYHPEVSWYAPGPFDPNWVLNTDANTAFGIYSGSGGYTLGSPKVSLAGNAFGIPATPAFESKIKKVEMAEFQLFTGKSLDWSVTPNRRLFVNADGTPNLDIPGPSSVLGKSPDIALCHSSGNWISGINSGTVSTSLKKTGTILPFTPDPKIGV